jgi:hypothetical protein
VRPNWDDVSEPTTLGWSGHRRTLAVDAVTTDLIVLSADDFAAMARGKPELALLFTKMVATA